MNSANNTGFQGTHIAMMCKYSGISFISGAVNHGFFSGQRSLVTAAIGVVLFAIGAVMEHRASEGQGHESLVKTLLLGALLSIGLGFFTGGLQHFPDSPARSGWVVPLGFVVSLFGLAATLGLSWSKTMTRYGIVASVLVALASCAGWQYYAAQGAHAGHDGHGAAAAPATGNASTQAYMAANDLMHKGMNIAFSGDADADFLAGMIPHHQGAVDMAKVVIAHGKDPKIKALAQQIIAAQDIEIAQMKSWQTGVVPKVKSAEDHSKHTHKH
jgi:Domain of unknown function (DUF305)